LAGNVVQFLKEKQARGKWYCLVNFLLITKNGNKTYLLKAYIIEQK
jgi:hypothetical protein